MAKKTGKFKKNVVEKKWAILCRNQYGEEMTVMVSGETETTAMNQISEKVEIVGIEEYKE